MDVDGRFTEEGQRVRKSEGLYCGESGELFTFGFGPWTLGGEATTGINSATLTFVSPSGRELECLFKVRIAREFESGEKGPLGGEVDAGFGVENFRKAATQSGRMGEKLGSGGQGDAGPVTHQSAGVLGTEEWRTHHGKCVEKQVRRGSAGNLEQIVRRSLS